MEVGINRKLRQLYLVEGKSAREIAKVFGVSATTIRDWMAKCNIPRRRCGTPANPAATYENLYRLYVTEKKSTIEIAKLLGLHRVTVFHHLQKFGITLRDQRKAVSEAPIKRRICQRIPFSGDSLEREYLLGFSEDLSVQKEGPGIEVALSTVNPSMLQLVNECFGKYSRISK